MPAEEVNTAEGIIDLTGDGGVLKKVLRPPTDPDNKPKDGYTVNVHYVGRFKDSGEEFDSSRSRGDEFSFKLNRHQVIKGWDIGVASMAVGELAELTCRGDYAYGENGAPPKIPPNATLVFEVELLSFEMEPETVDDRVMLANRQKEKGNALFKEGKLAEAVACYTKALNYFQHLYGISEEDKAKVDQVKLTLHLNLAACKLKLNELRDAILDCEKALDIDENNVKAIFRRGQARAKLCEFKQARADFLAAAKLAPNDVTIRKELEVLNKTEKASNEKEKKVLASMFSAYSSE